MLTRSQRIQGILVVTLGLIASLAAPRAAQAGDAYRKMEACSWTCPVDHDCTGATCKAESCWDNNNVERPYVLNCAAAM